MKGETAELAIVPFSISWMSLSRQGKFTFLKLH
jgi:hypothetical protein